MPAPKVKLSEVEKAINMLNDAPLRVDRQVCRAFEEYEAEIKALKDLVKELVSASSTFADEVRRHSQTPYPWPALDIALEKAEGVSPLLIYGPRKG